MSEYRYILRYYIDTDFAEDDRIAEIVDFCLANGIQEVMYFYNPEELFQGYKSQEEEDKWFVLAGKVKKALNAAGIDISINPWVTTGHVSRGRFFGENEKNIRPMIGETGVAAKITACPLDEEWQKKICSFWARMAREIAPTVLWIEDDWRLHNHDAAMGYGGCFCDEHLRLFAEKSGVKASREELLEAITAPGEPHPWRSIWLDICRETMIIPAEKIYAAVYAANKDVRIGLMSSQPDVHSAEGRDWRRLKAAFSPEKPLCIRPHMQPYTEWYALDIDPSTCRQTMAEFEPGEIEVYPELENSPRCGKYSKSGKFSVYQCIQAALCGSKGITINHYDMMGNGISLDYNFGKYLKKARPQLDEIVKLNIDDSSALAAKIHCQDNKTMHGLCRNNSAAWGHIFSKLGISHCITRKTERTGVFAVNNETLRTLSDGEILRLLAQGLILDGPSAEILLQKGFGDLIGITGGEWRNLDDDGYAYEDIVDGSMKVYGVANARMSASRCAASVFAVRTAEGAEKLTRINRYTKEELCPGAVFFRNRLGGKVLTVAYPLETSQFNMGYYNNFRRILWHTILLEKFAMTDIALGCDDPMQVFRHKNWCAFLNITQDDYDFIRFFAPGFPEGRVKMLDTEGVWKDTTLSRNADGSLTCREPLASLKCAVFRY